MKISKTGDFGTLDKNSGMKNNSVYKSNSERNSNAVLPFPPLPLFALAMFHAYLKKNPIPRENGE